MSQLKLLTHWSPTFIFMAQQSLVNPASNYSSHSAPAGSDFVYYNTRDYPSAEKIARIICRELCFVMPTAPWGSWVLRWDEWRVLSIPQNIEHSEYLMFRHNDLQQLTARQGWHLLVSSWYMEWRHINYWNYCRIWRYDYHLLSSGNYW
jgi:hypothetical protein